MVEKINLDKVGVKVGLIRFSKKTYSSEELFFESVSTQIMLLLKNRFLVSVFNDVNKGEVAIEFSSADEDSLTAIPVWMTPEQYLKFVTMCSEKNSKDEEDDYDMCSFEPKIKA